MKILCRYLNTKLRKCGYEKQVTIQKGASVVITNHATRYFHNQKVTQNLEIYIYKSFHKQKYIR